MRHFVIYDLADGRILQSCFASGVSDSHLLAQWPQPGQGLLFTAAAIDEPRAWRVVTGEVVPRAAMAPTISQVTFAADGAEACVITGLPDPCVVAMRGALAVPRTVVSGGSVTITSTVPGDIILRVTADPAYKAWETTIHAV